jgi:transcription antitermination protein NusB
MGCVDRNILRIAAYEILFCHDIPPKVSINEAVDIGKLYGTEESGSFINGILDGIYQQQTAKNKKNGNSD